MNDAGIHQRRGLQAPLERLCTRLVGMDGPKRKVGLAKGRDHIYSYDVDECERGVGIEQFSGSCCGFMIFDTTMADTRI